MKRILNQIPWVYLLPFALLLGLMPFRPQPHLVEKLIMLSAGELSRPVDVFDLLMHGFPLLLVVGKLLVGREVSSS